jgi:tRNA pseudouridine38-40 synthase
MGRLAIGVEYDGAAYHGWQRQPHSSSVQETLETALGRVANGAVELTCAGRTDTGVHARAQVAHFDTTARRTARAWLLGVNSALPPSINLCWVQSVPDEFHARYAALRRSYRYLVLNRPTRSALAAGRALVVYAPLDAARMQIAANALVGKHDFSAYRAAECQAHSPVRTIEALEVRRAGDWLSIEVTANAFLQHMVRNIVGTLLAVGRGEAGPERTREQLESRQRSTGEASAAAHGLYFWRVDYPAQFGLPDDSGMIDFYPATEVHAP